MADPATPIPDDQIPEELTSATPDYLEDEDGEVLTDDDGNPWLELA